MLSCPNTPVYSLLAGKCVHLLQCVLHDGMTNGILSLYYLKSKFQRSNLSQHLCLLRDVKMELVSFMTRKLRGKLLGCLLKSFQTSGFTLGYDMPCTWEFNATPVQAYLYLPCPRFQLREQTGCPGQRDTWWLYPCHQLSSTTTQILFPHPIVP